MTVSIIIPCYNERDNICSLVEAIKSVYPYDMNVKYLLVDNGSTDGTGEEIDKYVGGCIEKVTVPENRGYGYGLQAGIHAVTGSSYIGWIHGDIQCHPRELNQFFAYLSARPTFTYFLKGRRHNRSLIDKFFTWGQGVFDSMLFHTKMRDIAAIPAIYPTKVVKGEVTERLPNDFSIELYAYKEALSMGLEEVRLDVHLQSRKNGHSSWNTGLKSKLRQSKRIFCDSLKIKRGEKVL